MAMTMSEPEKIRSLKDKDDVQVFERERREEWGVCFKT